MRRAVQNGSVGCFFYLIPINFNMPLFLNVKCLLLDINYLHAKKVLNIGYDYVLICDADYMIRVRWPEDKHGRKKALSKLYAQSLSE